MKVYLASGSPHKIRACQKAFARFFPNVEIISVSVPSDIPEQPFGLEETRTGAENRVNGIADPERHDGYHVAIENGIFTEGGKYYDVGCIALRHGFLPHNKIGTTERVEFPREYVEQSLAKDRTVTAGSLMETAGVVNDNADPHIDLCGIPRWKLLYYALLEILIDVT